LLHCDFPSRRKDPDIPQIGPRLISGGARRTAVTPLRRDIQIAWRVHGMGMSCANPSWAYSVQTHHVLSICIAPTERHIHAVSIGTTQQVDRHTHLCICHLCISHTHLCISPAIFDIRQQYSISQVSIHLHLDIWHALSPPVTCHHSSLSCRTPCPVHAMLSLTHTPLSLVARHALYMPCSLSHTLLSLSSHAMPCLHLSLTLMQTFDSKTRGGGATGQLPATTSNYQQLPRITHTGSTEALGRGDGGGVQNEDRLRRLG